MKVLVGVLRTEKNHLALSEFVESFISSWNKGGGVWFISPRYLKNAILKLSIATSLV